MECLDEGFIGQDGAEDSLIISEEGEPRTSRECYPRCQCSALNALEPHDFFEAWQDARKMMSSSDVIGQPHAMRRK